MTVRISTDICFGADDIGHACRPATGRLPAYGVLRIGPSGANLFPDDTAAIDAMIAELVALRNEMAPPPPAPVSTGSESAAPGCGARHPIGAACELHRGGFHVAPGENEGDLDMEWRIDPEQLVAS